MAEVESGTRGPVGPRIDGPDGHVAAFDNVPAIPAPRPLIDPEHLATVAMVVRRPPELQFGPGLDAKTPHIEQLVLDELDPVLHRTTGELAYSVAELVIRREPEVTASEDPSGRAGLANLGEMVRMFEHLSVLQTGN